MAPIDPDAGSYATAFKIRLHDLRSFAAPRSKIDRIDRAYQFARAPIATMIEGTTNTACAKPGDLVTLGHSSSSSSSQ